ncbi:hypothetical protein, partial [Salmonella enterica]|uniref:hypothetical protein n=1 Tax=Salmonella enterica TaxID=28901 RepID=UPI003EDC80FC
VDQILRNSFDIQCATGKIRRSRHPMLMPHLFAIHLKNQHNRCWFFGCNAYRDKGIGQNKLWIANVTRHRD